MKKKFLLLASVVIIIILFIIKLNAWYSKNNLKFISEDMKEQIIEWLNIDKKYSNSLELISANQVSAGLSSHDKYCELIFKISKEEYEKLEKKGIEIIKEGKLAVLTMAGGQGTRLGYNGPKGTFDIGLDTHKSLFELIEEPIKEANSKYNVIIPWYIMTSNENNAETVKFFEDNKYFGYPKEGIKFFIQGELPMIDKEGKILVNEEGFLKLAADGHGGVFESMLKSGVLQDMNNKGVEWVFIGPVDNPLVNMVDPIFVAIADNKKCMAAGKSVVKARPEERVGVFCKRNSKPSVVEYTEISELSLIHI